MFKNKKDSLNNDCTPSFDEVLEESCDKPEINNTTNEEISSVETTEENNNSNEDLEDNNEYVQLMFNLEEENYDLNSDNSEDLNNVDSNMDTKYVSKEYVDELLKTLTDSKNKALKKGICISTAISALLTSSACGTFYLINKNNTPVNQTQIITNGENKTSNIYKAVATKATPSVVGITTLSINTSNFFSLPTQTEGVGSGVIVDSNGYILTNSHVVDDGQATKVSVLFNDGTTSDGEVLWNDATLDLAIVKVEKTNLDVAQLGDSDKIEVGDLSIAIGNPIGLELSKSVTQGIISGKDRSLSTGTTTMTDLLQTDASINPGNSGGPLLNDKGEVIGINTAKLSDTEGLGFAIPINIAKPIIEQIITKGDFQKVSLGIKGVDASNISAYFDLELSVKEGAYIVEIGSNSSASNAGLKTGDVITKIDDKEITSMSDLNKALYKYRKGDTAKFVVVREGKEQTINVSFTSESSTINKTENKKEESNTKNLPHTESIFDSFLD